MFKMIFFILLSVIVSVATTIGVLMRYSNISPKDVLSSNVAVADVPVERRMIFDVGQVEHDAVAVQMPENTVNWVQEEQESAEKSAPGQFDYQKLNRDLQAVSRTLEQFNNMIFDEIQRLKGSSQEKAKPENSVVDKMELE